MKCEICHKADAQEAVTRKVDGVEEELYVCKACAAAERKSRQKKSQRTRRSSSDMPPEVSITVGGNVGDAPPMLGAILNAVHGMMSDLAKVQDDLAEHRAPVMHRFPCGRVERGYRVQSRLHLEALNLIGDLEAVKRAFHALKMELVGVDADGIRDAGHVYEVAYQGAPAQAKRMVEDVLAQERNARIRLFEELPRVFGDSICRSLAVLKNCRLLSEGELFDMLSPLRLAAMEKILDGITLKEIEALQAAADLSSSEDNLSQDDRDKVDAERADRMNKMFEDVVLNDNGEERFLQS